MSTFRWREFKPTILFIARFLGVYLIGNILYGFFITAYHPAPDPVTVFVTEQTTQILNLLDPPVIAYPDYAKPSVVVAQDSPVVRVFEGCNGLNVVVVFLAFMLAYGEFNKRLIWFLPVGVLIIHLTNLFRIGLLFFISRDYPDQLYFFHKYLLTAFVYGSVFLLWFFWIRSNRIKGESR